MRLWAPEARMASARGHLLTPDGGFAPELEEAVEQPGSFLVLDRLDVQAPFDDQIDVTAVVAEIIGRLTDNYYAVVLPRTWPYADMATRLLPQAATDLAAAARKSGLGLLRSTRWSSDSTGRPWWSVDRAVSERHGRNTVRGSFSRVPGAAVWCSERPLCTLSLS
ncbi:hypothetical protein ACFYZB_44930 [Streptomyces sp. NPDC001852]|uniref:hypothetical protein n=1 Tax=Streptomyces sp. NPDC001852 TaxID=3364619 RepID=UPI00368EAEBF